MSTKLKDKDTKAAEPEVVSVLKTTSKVISSDLQRAHMLLQEVLVQLYKDADEYHAELHDKIVVELGD